MNYKITIFLIITNISTFLAEAQHWRSTKYTTEHGFPTDMIKTVAQDKQGFMWVGTDFGMVKFDGEKSVFYLDSLQYIKEIILKKDNKILITADLGLIEVETGIDNTNYKTLISYRGENSLVCRFPKIALEDIDNQSIWFSEPERICKLQNGKLKEYKFDKKNFGMSFIVSFSLCYDTNQTLWMVSNPGYLFYFDPKEDKFVEVELPEKILSYTYRIICPDKNQIWAACNNGICIIELSDNKEVIKQTLLTIEGGVTCINGTLEDGIMCGSTKNGLYEIDFRDKQNIKLIHIPQVGEGQINQIFLSKSKDWWICSNDGLILLQPSFFIPPQFSADSDADIKDKMIQSVYEAKDGKIYFTDSENIYQLDKANKWNLTALIKDPNNNFSPCRVVVKDDELWFASSDTRNYIYNFKNQTITNIPEAKKGLFVTSMEIDSSGKVWNTQNDYYIIKMLNQNKIERYYLVFYTPIIKNDSKGNLLLGGIGQNQEYLYKYNFKTNTFEDISHPNFYGILVNDMSFDTSNNIWLATDKGLFMHTEEGLYKIQLDENYNNIEIGSIACSYDGSVWLSNIYGVIRYKNKTSTLFNKNNGLAANTILPRNLIVDSENNLWAGTVKGVSYAKITDVISKKTPTPLILSCKVNDKKIYIKDSTEYLFPYNSYIELNFTSLVYPTEEIMYKTRIIGRDSIWSSLSSSKNLFIPNLQAGNYVLQIISQKSGDIYDWSEVYEFAFTIQQAWYKKWWAVIGFILIFILIIWAALKIHSRKLILENEHLEKIVRQRTAEILQQKEEIISQRDEIEQQNLEILQKNSQLSSQNRKITDSMTYASRIQQALIPTSQILMNAPIKYFILFKPRDIVSGDFYWFKILGKYIVCVAADCTGHGIPGAFMSVLGISTLNEIVTSRNIKNPAQILYEMRHYIKKTLQQTGQKGEQQDGMDIAFCTINTETKILYYAGANNPLWLIRKNETQNIEYLEYKADKMPIGVHPKDSNQFTNHEIQLITDDIFYIFSDGYESQFGGEKNEKMKVKYFREYILEICTHDLATQKDLLDKKLETWKGKNEQTDDIIILGVKI